MTGGGEQNVCGEFGGGAEVGGSCIGQREEAGRRAQRRWLQSTYRRGSLNLSD